MLSYPIPPALQASFEAHLAKERISSAKEICVLGSALYALFAIVDVWALPSALTQIWTLRICVICILLAIFWITRFPFFLRHYPPIAISLFLVSGCGVEIMVFLAGPNDLAKNTYYAGLIIVVMALYAWAFLPIWQQAMTGFALVVIYLLIAILVHDMRREGDWPILLTNSFFFVSANILGIVASHQRNRYIRESFLLRHELTSNLEWTEAQRRLSHYWSEHDSLTELPNRKHLMRKLELGMEVARAEHKSLALLFIDLDGFKKINDTQGHALGDATLQVISRRLKHCVREHDLLARIGGDEFVVVLRLDAEPEEIAIRLACSIIERIERPIRDPEIKCKLSASIGIAIFPRHAVNAENLLSVADHQMYAAKRKGKGTLCLAQ